MNTILLNYLIPLISAVLTGSFVGYITYKLNSKSKLEYYKQTSKDEQIDKWIDDLKTCVSTILDDSYRTAMDYEAINNQIDKGYYKLVPKIFNNFHEFHKKMGKLLLSLYAMLDGEGSQKILYAMINEYYGKMIDRISAINKKFDYLALLEDLIPVTTERTGKDIVDVVHGVLEDKHGVYKKIGEIQKELRELNKTIDKYIKEESLPDLDIMEVTKKVIKEKEQEKSYHI